MDEASLSDPDRVAICHNCRYFDSLPSTSLGRCRSGPPLLLTLREEKGEVVQDAECYGDWPRIDEQESCGRFRMKTDNLESVIASIGRLEALLEPLQELIVGVRPIYGTREGVRACIMELEESPAYVLLDFDSLAIASDVRNLLDELANGKAPGEPKPDGS